MRPEHFRMPKGLSPSALSRWENRRLEFYERYISPVRTPRLPQVNYMAVGSAFDAFVKSEIHSMVFGETMTKGSQFDFQKIFESQVEEHLRDEVYEKASFLFGQYKKTGAFGNLIHEILKSEYAPEMEFEVETIVNGVPIFGFPDLRYVTRELVHVVTDFKVNGSFSQHGVSPTQGFQRALSLKKDGTVKTEVHKKYRPKQFKDIEISENCLSDFSEDWATQIAMYAWCLGEEVGKEDYVVRMEQVACRPNNKVKIASHVSQISSRYHLEVMRRLVEAWGFIEKGHIFTDLTFEENLEQCEIIDQRLAIPFGLHSNPAVNKYLRPPSLRFK